MNRLLSTDYTDPSDFLEDEIILDPQTGSAVGPSSSALTVLDYLIIDGLRQ